MACRYKKNPNTCLAEKGDSTKPSFKVKQWDQMAGAGVKKKKNTYEGGQLDAGGTQINCKPIRSIHRPATRGNQPGVHSERAGGGIPNPGNSGKWNQKKRRKKITDCKKQVCKQNRSENQKHRRAGGGKKGKVRGKIQVETQCAAKKAGKKVLKKVVGGDTKRIKVKSPGGQLPAPYKSEEKNWATNSNGKNVKVKKRKKKTSKNKTNKTRPKHRVDITRKKKIGLARGGGSARTTLWKKKIKKTMNPQRTEKGAYGGASSVGGPTCTMKKGSEPAEKTVHGARDVVWGEEANRGGKIE